MLDKVDLLLIHTPHPPACNSSSEIATTWVGMEAALKANMTAAIGVSNFNAAQLEALAAAPAVTEVPSVNQILLHVGQVDVDTIAYCTKAHIVTEVREWKESAHRSTYLHGDERVGGGGGGALAGCSIPRSRSGGAPPHIRQCPLETRSTPLPPALTRSLYADTHSILIVVFNHRCTRRIRQWDTRTGVGKQCTICLQCSRLLRPTT